VRRASSLALALVFLSGCGGGSGGPALTKQQYAAKADSICGTYNKQVNALGNPTNLQDLATVADKTLPILGSAIDKLDALKPPASEKAKADQWLTQVRNLRDDLQEIRDKAKAGDAPGIQSVLPKAQDHNSKSNSLAAELGMSVCNKD
jgi:hypothetical protein